MPGLRETMYCSQQIHIPPTYPHLLRQFAKAAIRTQPYDLLRWSCAYFRALSKGIEPPVKYRLEYPEPKNHMGLTPGLIKVLLRQLISAQLVGESLNECHHSLVFDHTTILTKRFGISGTVPFGKLLEHWHGICLQDTDLLKILLLGSFENAEEIPFYKFIAVAVGHLNENLTQTMIMLCELLTEEPEGGSAMIPVNIFLNLYEFLAKINASKPIEITNNLFFIPSYSQILDETTQYVDFSESTQFNGINMNMTQSVDILKHPTVDPLQKASRMPAEFEVTKVLECTDETCMNLNRSESSLAGEQGVLKVNKGMIKITGVSNEEVALETTEDFASKEDIGEEGSNMTIEDVFTDNIEDVEATYEDVENEDVERNDSLIVGMEKVNLPSSLDSALRSPTPSPTPESGSATIIENKPLTQKSVKYPTEPVRFADDSLSESTESGTLIKYKAGGMFPPGFEYVDYYIHAIKGIGPIVDNKMIEKFMKYISERAQEQQGMIMPRNIRHFLCPPLEEERDESEESSTITKKVPVVASTENKFQIEEPIEDFDDDDDYGPPPCATCECDCICKENY